MQANPLTNRHEEDLRWFFGAGLSVDGGARSTIGAQLEALQFKLPPNIGGNDPLKNHDAVVRAVHRDRTVRVILSRLPAWQVHVLRSAYGDIPEQCVWGLVKVFGTGSTARDGRETASLAVSLRTVDAPGASQWESVTSLVRRAENGSGRAKGELSSLVEWTHRALRASRDGYRMAEQVVRQEAREKRAERTAEVFDLLEWAS